MKVIIAGSRGITDYDLVKRAIVDSGFTVTSVVCGMASGVDTLGAQYARQNGIPVLECPADWAKYGKAAGRIRNAQIAMVADALIAITNGSPGTRNMIAIAQGKKIPTYVVDMNEAPNSRSIKCSTSA